jgi:hypothetical protein
VDWRYGSELLLARAVPELKTNVEVVDDSVLEREIKTDGRGRVCPVLFTLESIDEGGLTNIALSDETDLDIFINITGLFVFGKDLHERVIEK